VSRKPGSLKLKDPSSVEPMGVDWTTWLAELSATETITLSTWSVSGADAILTLSSPSIVTGSLKTQVKLNANTVGLTYTVTNHITTSGGSQDDRSFFVLVEQR